MELPLREVGRPPKIYPNFSDLRVQHFSTDELRNLCFDVSVDYEDLPEGGKRIKAQELVDHCRRVNLLADLAMLCRQFRPHVNWT